jgi:hypothetical protein
MKNAAKISAKMSGIKMNEKLYLEIVDEADNLFKKYSSGIKGQQLTVSDNLDYWMVMVAHNKGFKAGYQECLDTEVQQLLQDANIVTGEDAERLAEAMDNPTPISDEERKRMKENYERFNIKN